MSEIEHPRPNARVFVTNLGFHDYTPAERWGELVAVTSGRENLKNTDRLEWEMQQVLKKMTDNDYLCISGSPVLAAIAVGFVLRRFGYVDLLFWDALYSDYRYRKFTFDEKKLPGATEVLDLNDEVYWGEIGPQ